MLINSCFIAFVAGDYARTLTGAMLLDVYHLVQIVTMEDPHPMIMYFLLYS